MPVVTNEDFLGACFGARWADAHVTGFIEPPEALEGLGLRHYWAGYRWSRGYSAPAPSDNNYFTISLFRDDPADGQARRRKELFEATHVIVVDDVGTKVRAVDVLDNWPDPSWMLETSPGNFQWGYILDAPEGDAGRVNALLDGMIAAGLCADGKDPGMKGVTRYVRLPVGRNTKAKYGAGGFTCFLAHWQPKDRFSLDDLAARWGITLPAPGTAGAGGRVSVSAAEDELLGLLDGWGMVQGWASDGKGYLIECPWVLDHTDRVDSGTAYWLNGGFKCHHGHCEQKGRRELECWADERLQAESAGLVRLSSMDFPPVAGFRAANGGARGGVVSVPVVGAGVGTGGGGTGTRPGTAVDRFFGELVYLREEDRFYDLRSDGLVSRAAVDLVWNAELRSAGALPVLVPKTGETMRPVAWFFDEANTGRAKVADVVTYWPGEGRLFRDGAVVKVNCWVGVDGTGLSVGDADVEPWMKLVRHIVGVEGADVVDAVLDWMSLVVGAPGVKPGWHVVVQGGQGLGKDLMIQPLIAGVGERNKGTVNAVSLHSPFNAWAERRLVVVNELKQNTRGSATGADQYTTLKELTENTNATVKINEKNQRAYYAQNVSAFWVTSNDEAAIALEADDRRFLVVMAAGARKWTAGEYAGLAGWMRAGGAALAADWLRDRWDGMGAVRRDALLRSAPSTPGKLRMIENCEDPVVAFMRDQIATGVWPALMTAKDVSGALAAAAKGGAAGFSYAPSPNRWGASLRRLGGGKVYNGEPVRLKNGDKTRLWATREPERFSVLGEPQLAQAYISAAGHAFSDGTTGDKTVTNLTPVKV